MMRTNRPVTSREYKLILNPDRFSDRERGIKALGEVLTVLVQRAGGEVKGLEYDDRETRRTWYMDTPDWTLQRYQFILRLRFEEDDERYKLTLKHRAPDRYLAASQAITRHKDDDPPKFEEDILPAFRSVFSLSSSFKTDTLPKLNNAKDLRAVFAGLDALHLAVNTPIKRVNDFQAYELFYKLCKVRFEGGADIKVGLSFWYLNEAEPAWPLVGELSYDFDLEQARSAEGEDLLEGASLPLISGANELFQALQQQDGWITAAGTTKTAFAYNAMRR